MSDGQNDSPQVAVVLPIGGVDEELYDSSALLVNGRFVYLWPSNGEVAQTAYQVGELVAKALGVELTTVEIADPNDISSVRAALERQARESGRQS